ncbi:MAG TPA: hypothetical protein VJC13_00835 [Candidatus Paceibacterota bacterium]
MNDYLQKIKLLSAKLKIRKISYKRGGIKPLRDWGLILLSVFIVSCILVVSVVYFYIQIEHGTLFIVTSDGSESQIKINADLLRATVSDINTREKTNDAVKNGGLSIPSDPSI